MILGLRGCHRGEAAEGFEAIGRGAVTPGTAGETVSARLPDTPVLQRFCDSHRGPVPALSGPPLVIMCDLGGRTVTSAPGTSGDLLYARGGPGLA